MLTGYYENSIDAKGRLIVPQSFREQLGEEFVLTRSDTKCIRIYSKDEYDKLYTNIAKAKAEGKPGVQGLLMLFINSAKEARCDSQGRLQLPPELRIKAGLEKETVTVGCMDRVEIWDKAEYNKLEEALDMAAVQEAIDYVGAR
jgi:MraZ protein